MDQNNDVVADLKENKFICMKKNEIGKGSSCTIYKIPGENIAVKKLNKITRHALRSLKNEKMLLQLLDHHNIVGYRGFEDNRLFLDLAENDLQKIFIEHDDKYHFSTVDRIDFLKQIASALNYLHYMKVVHRDIKPANVFIKKSSDKYLCLIGDFGMSFFVSDDLNAAKLLNINGTSPCAGTARYIAPEVLKDIWDMKDLSIDIFSFGLTAWSIFEEVVPYAKIKNIRQLQNKFSQEPQEPLVEFDKTPEKARNIISNCVQFHANRRTNSKILSHDLNNLL